MGVNHDIKLVSVLIIIDPIPQNSSVVNLKAVCLFSFSVLCGTWSKAVQLDFLWWRKYSVSALSSAGTISHMSLLST